MTAVLTSAELEPLVAAGTVLVGALGLLIGSFLNVVVYRVPAGMSVVSPPSACPRCGTGIRPIDNVPVLSWVVLGGRCRSCRTSIPVRYPLVELAGGLAFIGVAWWWTARALPDSGDDLTASDLTASDLTASDLSASDLTASDLTASDLGASGLALVAFLYLAAITISLALIDLDVHRLPDVIVLPAYPVLAVLLGSSSVLVGDVAALGRAAIGGVALAAFYLVLALVKPGAMGLGDVKLAGVLGLALAWLGWPQLIVGAFAAFVTGGVFALILLATRRASRATGIPFGPWMLLGAWIGCFAGAPLAHLYLSSLGLG
jgi:leader peptidase (prepilin peptidase)/N-methyltransferase